MSKWRSVAFAIAIVLLAASVPILGWIGLTVIRNSKAGTLVTRVSDPRAPGYEAIVDPTPTALIIQKNARGTPIGLTFLSLGGTSGGGSAMFLPMGTAVTRPARPGDKYSTAYRVGGQRSLVNAVGTTLNAGLSDVISMDDRLWASLTANSAPIRFENPDTLTGSLRLAAGPVALQPSQVGPYLAALNPGENELNRLNRNQVFWQAWLKQIAASTAADVIPGETGSGIGLFVSTLSKGPVRLESLPVKPESSSGNADPTIFYPAGLEVRRTMAQMVPYPVPPNPGARVLVRLLNGVDGEPIPQSMVRRIVINGGSIAIIGNDHRFGRAITSIQYRDPAARNRAVLMQYALGGRGRIVLNVQGSDAVDLTIVLGRDLLPSGGTTSKQTSSPTTRPRSSTPTSRSQNPGG